MKFKVGDKVIVGEERTVPNKYWHKTGTIVVVHDTKYPTNFKYRVLFDNKVTWNFYEKDVYPAPKDLLGSYLYDTIHIT